MFNLLPYFFLIIQASGNLKEDRLHIRTSKYVLSQTPTKAKTMYASSAGQQYYLHKTRVQILQGDSRFGIAMRKHKRHVRKFQVTRNGRVLGPKWYLREKPQPFRETYCNLEMGRSCNSIERVSWEAVTISILRLQFHGNGAIMARTATKVH